MTKTGGAVSTPRIVLWDVETAHNILAKFDLREEYTSHGNILQERYMICGAWKVLGERRVSAVSVLDDPKRFSKSPADDRHVVQVLREVLMGADVIVAHNGDQFDLKWLNGRMLFHGMEPLPPIPSVDTLRVARRVFMLNSNRLDYLGKYLGIGGKTSTPQGLWIEVLKGSAKAIRTMVAYNKRDVELLEDVFVKLRPYAPEVFNRHLVEGQEKGCPRCGSDEVQRRGVHRSITQTYQRWQCQSCRGWFRSRTADKRKAGTRVL